MQAESRETRSGNPIPICAGCADAENSNVDLSTLQRLYRSNNACSAVASPALAWARLGYAYAWTINFVPSVDVRGMAVKSRQAFEQALALNPDLPEAYVAAGFYQEWARQDNVAAQAEFKRALALNPRDADAQLALADTEYHLGHLDEANVAYERAVSLDPARL